MLKKYENFNGGKLSTFRIGGNIKKLLIASSVKDLKEAIKILQNEKNWYLLGGGSNILISDDGVDGIIKLNGNFSKIKNQEKFLICGAGAFGSSAIKYAEKKSLSGLEPFSGLPGTIGGWIATNCGPSEMNILDILESVDVIDKKTYQLKTLKRNEFDYGYRYCSLKEKFVILSAKLKLKKRTKQEIKEGNEKYMKYRLSTQPKGSSVGCIFKNPPNNSAGKIIDSCGLKGFKMKNLKISKKHGNFIINEGGAKAKEVFEMIQVIKTNVFEKTGISLTAEVEKIGKFKYE